MPEIALFGLFGPPPPGPSGPYAGSAWVVQLYRTVPLGDATAAYTAFVEDAAVRVVDESGRLVANLEYRGLGYYVADGPLPEAGVRYTLEANAPGLVPVRASSAVPLALQHLDVAADGQGNVRVQFLDPIGSGNAYTLEPTELARPGVPVLFATSNASVVVESFVESVSNSGGRPLYSQALFDDALFNGGRFDALLDVSLSVSGPAPRRDSLAVAVTALSPEAFAYMRTARLAEEAIDNPFADPVLLAGNVTGGRGLFAGVNARVSEAVLP